MYSDACKARKNERIRESASFRRLLFKTTVTGVRIKWVDQKQSVFKIPCSDRLRILFYPDAVIKGD